MSKEAGLFLGNKKACAVAVSAESVLY